MLKQHGIDDFDRLVRENQRVVYHIALSVVGNAADAQDVAQDAFMRAYAKLGSLSDPEQFRAWVCRIARRVALNHVRSSARSRRREETTHDDLAAIDVEAVAAEREFTGRVHAAIDGLPPKFRDVMLLCAIEGLEPSEVAYVLGIPAGTVRSRLHAARKQLLGILSS
jgi:RNA polymerase sigma-70 factor (ECF subfamily)